MNNPRGTDKPFYQLMQLSGSAVLKLFGIPAEQAEHYIFRATVIKEVTLQPDIEGILFFDDTEHERVYIEFQGYLDKLIRQRLVANIALSCLHTEYTHSVTAAIIYTDEVYQTNALSLYQVNGAPFIPLREIVLTHYTEAELVNIDPRLLVLAPFTLKNPQRETPQTLQPKADHWKKQLVDIYSSQEYSSAVYLISLFLLSRCKKLSYQEVHKMFHIDLMETQAGQDIFAMGETQGIEKGIEQGIERGIERGIEKGIEQGMKQGTEQGEIHMARSMLLELLVMQFGELPEAIPQRIQAIDSVEKLRQLFKHTLHTSDLNAFEDLLDQSY